MGKRKRNKVNDLPVQPVVATENNDSDDEFHDAPSSVEQQQQVDIVPNGIAKKNKKIKSKHSVQEECAETLDGDSNTEKSSGKLFSVWFDFPPKFTFAFLFSYR